MRVFGIPSKGEKLSQIKIPKTAYFSTTVGAGTSLTAFTGRTDAEANDSQLIIDIRDPYGVSLFALTNEIPNGTIANGQLVSGTGDNANYYLLTPSLTGTYTVQYAIKNDGFWVTSPEYKISVSSESYSMEFSENNRLVMPDKVNTSTDREVKIALPKLFDNDGNRINQFVLNIDNTDASNPVYTIASYENYAGEHGVYMDANNMPVQYNGTDTIKKNIYKEYYTYVIRKISKTALSDDLAKATAERIYPTITLDSLKYSLIVNVDVPSKGNEQDSAYKMSNSNSFITTSNGKDKVLDINFATNETTAPYESVAYKFTAGSGENVINYKLTKNSGTDTLDNLDSNLAATFSNTASPVTYISKTVDGSPSYDANKIDIAVSTSSTLDYLKFSLNKKVYLPTINVMNKTTKNNVNAFYYYEIAYIKESATEKSTYEYGSQYLTLGVDDGGVYAIPYEKGKYNIFFNAIDFYGNRDANADAHDYDIENVKDRTSPKMHLVKGYEYDITDAEEFSYNNYTEDGRIVGSKNSTESKTKVDLENYSYIMSSRVELKGKVGDTNSADWSTITIPAIFTVDNLSPFNNLSITRTVSSDAFIDLKSSNTSAEDKKKEESYQQKKHTIYIQSSSGGSSLSPNDPYSGVKLDDILKFTENVYNNYFICGNNFYKFTKDKSAQEINSTNFPTNSDKELEAAKKALGELQEDGKTSTGTITDKKFGDYYISKEGYYKIGSTYYKATSLSAEELKKAKSAAEAQIVINPNIFGAGDYTISFSVYDSSNNANDTSGTFKFTVVKSEDGKSIDEQAPTVKFSTVNATLGNVTNDQKISLDLPEIYDNYDERPYVRYFLAFDENKTAGTFGFYKEIKTTRVTENDKTVEKLVFNMNDTYEILNKGQANETVVTIYDKAKTSGKFSILALAYDDYALTSKKIGYNPIDNKNPSGETDNFTLLKLVEPKTDAEKNAESNKKYYQNIGYDTYSIYLKIADTVAPIVKNSYSVKKTDKTTELVTNNTSIKQGDKVLIRGIQYLDDSENVTIRVRVKDQDGNECSISELGVNDFKTTYLDTITNETQRATAEDDLLDQLSSRKQKLASPETIEGKSYNYLYTFPGFTFTASSASVYTITYEIKDADNIALYSFVTTPTKDTEKPVISGLDGTTSELELGLTRTFPKLKVTDNNSSESEISVTQYVTDANNVNCSRYLTEVGGEWRFFPAEVGTYTITFRAKDKDGNRAERQINITVKDTLAPTVTLNNGTEDKIVVSEDKIKKESGTAVYDPVSLPSFTTSDQHTVDGKELASLEKLGSNGTLTITAPDGTTTYTLGEKETTASGDNKIKLKRVADHIEFTPTERGSYKATYSAEDLNGNQSKDNKTITIEIGDTRVPDIYLTDKLVNALKNGFNITDGNNKLVINSRARISGQTGDKSQDLYVYDNFGFTEKTAGEGDSAYKYNEVTIQVYDENNNEVSKKETTSEGVVTYEFTKAGTYTITFRTRDSVYKEGVRTETFTVSSQTTAKSDSTAVLPIVLTVVSVLILAGVVIYFIRGTKFLPKRKKKNKKEKAETKNTEQV